MLRQWFGQTKMRWRVGLPLLFAAVQLGWMVFPSTAAEPPVTAVAFSPDGKQVVTGSQAGLMVVDWPTLRRQRALETDLAQIHGLSFSPDGQTLAASGGTPSVSGGCEVFRWPQGKKAGQYLKQADVAYQVTWNATGTRLASCSLDKTCHVFDPASIAGRQPGRSGSDRTTAVVIEGHSRGLLCGQFLPDVRLIVTGSIDQSLRVWRIGDSDVELVRTLRNHTASVFGLALRPAGGEGLPVMASIGEDRTVRLWQPTIGRMMRFVRLDHAVPLSVSWTPDGSRLVIGCDDGHVRVIDPDTMTIERDLEIFDGHVYCVACHPVIGSIVAGGPAGQLTRIDTTASSKE